MEVRSILILGDSLSKGVVYDREKQRYCCAKDSFVKTMQNFLCPTVYNKAKFGATIEYGSSLLVPKMREIDPQVVLIEFGGNDCDFDWNAIAENPFADHRPKTEIPVFEAHLTEMIEQVRDFGKVPVLMNLPPLNAPAYFRWFTQGDAKKAEDILKWLGDVTHIYWWHERYSSTIERVSRRMDCHLIDVRGPFLQQEDYRGLLCLDGIHPNSQGHKVIARAIRDEIICRDHGEMLLGGEECLAY